MHYPYLRLNSWRERRPKFATHLYVRPLHQRNRLNCQAHTPKPRQRARASRRGCEEEEEKEKEEEEEQEKEEQGRKKK